MKRPLKYLLIIFGILLALRICFALWFNISPVATINHFVTGLKEAETRSDEYQIGNCWTTIEVTSYSFNSCDTTSLYIPVDMGSPIPAILVRCYEQINFSEILFQNTLPFRKKVVPLHSKEKLKNIVLG